MSVSVRPCVRLLPRPQAIAKPSHSLETSGSLEVRNGVILGAPDVPPPTPTNVPTPLLTPIRCCGVSYMKKCSRKLFVKKLPRVFFEFWGARQFVFFRDSNMPLEFLIIAQ